MHSLYEHICLENQKQKKTNAGKFYDQQQYNAILETAMVSTPEEFNDNIMITPNQYESIKSLVQENHSINFQRHWMSNIKLMFVS